jgi:uncharacterized protein (TIGR02328 family)
MRLWHYELISVLPNKMLVSQWRELIAINRQWEKGTLIHPLVSYVKEYSKDYFAYYVHHVYLEMLKRNIKCKDSYMEEIISFCRYRLWQENLNYSEHNQEYLFICYYNLKEKYLREIINPTEWDLIESKVGKTL